MLGLAAALVPLAAGCETNSFLNPAEVGTYPVQPRSMPILDTLDVDGLDETEALFADADDPTPDDLVADVSDYLIGPNDFVRIEISDLVSPGVTTPYGRRVTESGTLSLPLLDEPIKASGMTEAELESDISDAYRDSQIIREAQVVVTVLEQRNRTFSVLGAVGAPGQYQILKSDFRILDALVLFRDVQLTVGLDYIYIIRQPDSGSRESGAGNGQPQNNGDNGGNGGDPLLDGRRGSRPIAGDADWAMLLDDKSVSYLMQDNTAGTTAPNSDDGLVQEPADADTMPSPNQPGISGAGVTAEGNPLPVRGNPDERVIIDPFAPPPLPGTQMPAQPANPGTTSGVNPVPLPAEPSNSDMGGPRTPGAAGSQTPPIQGNQDFTFTGPDNSEDIRVIRIPIQQLKRGDLKFNIVIKPDDLIIVPQPTTGLYYMGGHVNRVGVYTIPLSKITLKQAIISAGMLDQVAMPYKTTITRRVGPNQEVTVRLDLGKVFAGQEPDVYLKPDDQVMVGTNAFAPFLAAIRNGFRVTYGFGFLYDRNFGDQDNR